MKGHTGTIRIVKFAPPSSASSSTTLLLGSAGAGDFRTRIWDIEAGSSLFFVFCFLSLILC